jgi:uncharacterized membrane protein YuzA (DUF378 family)
MGRDGTPLWEPGGAAYIRSIPPRKTRKKMAALNLITLAILIVGGLNLSSTAFSDVDFVTQTFGDSWLAKLAYAVIGFSALYQILPLTRAIGRSDDAPAKVAKA